MTGRRFEGSPPRGQGVSAREGFTMADVLLLPTIQRQLVTWMLRQGAVSLTDVMTQTRLSEADAEAELEDLAGQGFVEVLEREGGDRRYRARLAARRGKQVAETLMQALEPGKPLAVILSSSGEDTITPGSTFRLGVTIRNKGNQSAVIDLYIDDLSPVLRQWCDSAQERLALGAKQSSEVVFEFHVPIDALPGSYRYLLVVDAPQHYPEDTPIRHSLALQVLPPSQDLVRVSDPTFALIPSSSSLSPLPLAPGSALQFQLQVHNRADRVDRFRLSCLDLPPSWFTIFYPQGVQGQGLAVEADSLDLNPGDRGEILLTITPPLDAVSGSYIPTLRLRSENNPDLVMLDLIYLEITPIYQVQAELRTIISRIRTNTGLFAVQVTNNGNTERHLRLVIKPLDGGDLCNYALEPENLRVLPYQTSSAQLWVKPKKPNQRPWFGGGKLVNFSVELEDTDQLPLTPVPMQGFVMWEPRPWWQLLPLFVAGFVGLVALIFLLWWLLFRPPVVPQIVQFFPEDTQYSIANQDVVRLGFQISNPHRLRSLRIIGQGEDGTVISGPLEYEFTGDELPEALTPFCRIQEQLLTCRNLRTDARRAGTYVFELSLVPRRGRGAQPTSATSVPVAITPLPLPEVVEFISTLAEYQEAPPAPASGAGAQPTSAEPEAGATGMPPIDPHMIQLNWVIAHPDQIKELRIVGKTPDGAIASPPRRFDLSQGIPEELQPFCQIQEQLICVNVPTGDRAAGDYIFELTVIPQSAPPETPITSQTELIKILPLPPQIRSFQINGEEALPKYVFEVDQGLLPPVIVISWDVLPSGGQVVELLPAPGNVAPAGAIPFPLAPEPGTSVLTLQVTNAAGQQVMRSVTIETFDPTPGEAAPGAPVIPPPPGAPGAPGAGAGADEEGAPGSGTPGLSSPSTVEPGTLSPSEVPPQFD